LQEAPIKYHLGLTVKSLLDIEGAKFLANVRILQTLAGKARNSYRFNISLFSLLCAFQPEMAVSNITYAFHVCLILTQDILQRFEGLFVTALLHQYFTEQTLEFKVSILLFNQLDDFLCRNAHRVLI
jgi:hypothetical protein